MQILFHLGTFPLTKQDILPSASALTVYVQFLLIISFLMINSRPMGSTSTNHGDGHIGIDNAKEWLMDRLVMIYIMREMVFDQETVC
jgi:hypothetical protein